MADLRALEEQDAAANPIAPSRRRKTVKGGAAVKERATVKKMADRRALEEQYLHGQMATGATPSVGVSVARGGRKKLSLAKALAHETPSLHNAMEDEIAEMPSGEYDGAGKHTLMDHLSHPMKGFGDYLHALEGGMDTGRYQGEGMSGGVRHPGNTELSRAAAVALSARINNGTASLERTKALIARSPAYTPAEKVWLARNLKHFVGSRNVEEAMRKVTKEDPFDDDGGVGSTVAAMARLRLHERRDRDDDDRPPGAGAATGRGATPSAGLSQFRGGMAMGQVVGGGKADKIALVVDEMSDSESDMEGGALRPMMCDDMPGTAAIGVARRKRAPAGPDDGRRKRAEVVKRVMADKGLSMIEASKYVKANNLYPGSSGSRAPAGAASGPPKRPPPGRPSAAQAAAARRRAAANPGGPEAAAML